MNQPYSNKRIIQKDTWSCYACVAAMITGKPVEDVFNFLGHDGSGFDEKSSHPEKRRGISTIEIIQYLSEHRYSLGEWAVFKDHPINLAHFNSIELNLIIEGTKAVIIVESQRLKNCHHVIYWDGFHIFDPNPLQKDLPSLSEYKVIQFIPILYHQED